MQTLIQGPKLDSLLRLLRFVAADVDGLIAECGVFQGGSLAAMANVCPDRVIYGFDTFTGLPVECWGEHELHKAGEFAASLDVVQNNLRACRNIRLVPGLFPDSAEGVVDDDKFAFVHLDLDFYESTKQALAWFLPRMERRGVIVFDDVDWPNCPGVRRAIAEAEIKVRFSAPYQAYYINDGNRL